MNKRIKQTFIPCKGYTDVSPNRIRVHTDPVKGKKKRRKKDDREEKQVEMDLK